jgi:hypothetical protein
LWQGRDNFGKQKKKDLNPALKFGEERQRWLLSCVTTVTPLNLTPNPRTQGRDNFGKQKKKGGKGKGKKKK